MWEAEYERGDTLPIIYLSETVNTYLFLGALDNKLTLWRISTRAFR